HSKRLLRRSLKSNSSPNLLNAELLILLGYPNWGVGGRRSTNRPEKRRGGDCSPPHPHHLLPKQRQNALLHLVGLGQRRNSGLVQDVDGARVGKVVRDVVEIELLC